MVTALRSKIDEANRLSENAKQEETKAREAMRQGEDYDFWLKASRVAEMHSLNGPVALYRIHGASAMHRLSAESHLVNLLKAASMRWGLKTLGGQSLGSGA